jgi:hypothetical protein
VCALGSHFIYTRFTHFFHVYAIRSAQWEGTKLELVDFRNKCFLVRNWDALLEQLEGHLVKQYINGGGGGSGGSGGGGGGGGSGGGTALTAGGDAMLPNGNELGGLATVDEKEEDLPFVPTNAGVLPMAEPEPNEV